MEDRGGNSDYRVLAQLGFGLAWLELGWALTIKYFLVLVLVLIMFYVFIFKTSLVYNHSSEEPCSPGGLP